MSGHWHEWAQLGKPHGWPHLHAIAVSRNRDGRLEVFGVRTDGELCQIWQTAPNGGWSHWECRGKPTDTGVALGGPAVGKTLAVEPHADGRLAAFVVADRAVWLVQQTAPNNRWGAWQALGRPPASGGVVSLDALRDHDGRLQLFVVSYTNRMAGRGQTEPNGDWGDWDADFPHDDGLGFHAFAVGQNEDGRIEIVTSLSGTLALVTPGRTGFGNGGLGAPVELGPLSIAPDPEGKLVAAMTVGGELVHMRQRVANQPPSPGGGGWARQNLGRPEAHVAVSGPVLATNRDGGLALFIPGSDGNLWHRDQTDPNGPWGGWHNLGSPSHSGEGFASVGVGPNANGQLGLFVVHQGVLWERRQK